MVHALFIIYTYFSNVIIMFSVSEYEKQGTGYLNNFSESELTNVILDASDAYYNSSSGAIMSDELFDYLLGYMQSKYPYNKTIKHLVRAEIPNGYDAAVLPYSMPSIAKILDDEKALQRWLKKMNVSAKTTASLPSTVAAFTVSCKLDGASVIYSNESGAPMLYSHGGGIKAITKNQFIPYLIPPHILSLVEPFSIRGEIIISNANFNARWSSTYKAPRNMISAVVNSDDVHPALQSGDIVLVAHELYVPLLCKQKQYERLHELKYPHIVEHYNTNIIDIAEMREKTLHWRYSGEYASDGSVIVSNAVSSRIIKEGQQSAKPLSYAIAFKMTSADQIATVTITNIELNPSKDGYVIPRATYSPVVIGGQTYTHANVGNMRNLVDNGIWIGAIVEIKRCGDVIPNVINVKTPVEPELPDWAEWIPTRDGKPPVNMRVKSGAITRYSSAVEKKLLVKFFEELDVPGMREKTIDTLYDVGGFKTIKDFIVMRPADLLEIEGFGKKKADTICNGIRDAIQRVSLQQLMSASNLFGRGLGLETIEKIYSYWGLGEPSATAIEEICQSVPSIGVITATKYLDGIKPFLHWLKINGLEHKLYEPAITATATNTNSSKSLNLNIVWTGTRNPTLMKQIENAGCTFAKTVSKKTDVVINGGGGKNDDKLDKIRAMGIPILTPEEFINQHQFSLF